MCPTTRWRSSGNGLRWARPSWSSTSRQQPYLYATIPSIVRRGSPGSSFQLAAYCALGSGIGGFLYSIAFVLMARPSPKLGAGLSWVLLMIGGFLSAGVVVAPY